MKFIIATLMAAIYSTSTMAFVISNGFINGGLLKTNGFINGGLLKTNGFINGFNNGFVKTNGFVNGFDNGLVKTNGFVNGFNNGLVKTNGFGSGLVSNGLVSNGLDSNGVVSNGISNGLSVARINSVQTNFPNQLVATVENIAALPVAPLPVASSFATVSNFAKFD
jgi:hypothetical protein